MLENVTDGDVEIVEVVGLVSDFTAEDEIFLRLGGSRVEDNMMAC